MHAAQVDLEPGRVYRTAHLRAWGANPTRLARRLEAGGALVCLGFGLWLAPRANRFGRAPAADEALLEAFLDGTPWVRTGPSAWNALGLGSTALFAHPLVYNTKRSGRFVIGGRTFELRREAFPPNPPPEWYVVDLLRHADSAGVDRQQLIGALRRRRDRFDVARLREMAGRFGTRAERDAIARALA
jgi:hypothetical protein